MESISSKTRILRFAPFILPVFMGWGKRQIPLISPWLASVKFTKFRTPPPLSFELKTMSRIFPCPGAEKPIHPLVFPDIFPWLARGPTPGASRCCLCFHGFSPLFTLGLTTIQMLKVCWNLCGWVFHYNQRSIKLLQTQNDQLHY